jgi:hypothetical protein
MTKLERDLLLDPPAICAYHDLPLAIFHYAPREEHECRRHARLLASGLEQRGRRVQTVSLARLFWQAIRETEGVVRLGEEERQYGYERAQKSMTALLSDPDFRPLPALVLEKLEGLDRLRSVVFLVRAAALAPTIYHMSKLLDELHGQAHVPTVLFYPGSLDGLTGLTFMSMEDREATGNYRVKIY